ncbi:MAG: NAD-dependent epimerase/dehydratase family protein [Anaerolineae bacterium]|nr:NAD-dependent epimerase/dehydratase family protein [Anaerolineae bacterium]
MINPTPSPCALVTGGTGAIGPKLVRQLVTSGYQVKVLVRQEPPAGLLPAHVEIIRGDICDKQRLEVALAGVDYVFHLAAKLHINNPPDHLIGEYERINVHGTCCVVEAALAAQVQRLVFFSTISVYGPSYNQSPITEQSLPNPQSLYAQTKYRAEQYILAARRNPQDPALGVVLRLGAVYGARIKGNYARLVTALRRKRFLLIGSGQNRRTLVHERDVIEAALLAAESPQAAGQIYNVTDGDTPTFNEIVTAICQSMGQPVPRWHLPEGPVRFLVQMTEQGFHWVGQSPPVGHHTLDKLMEDVAVSGEKIQEELGFQPNFDLYTGWTIALKELGLF